MAATALVASWLVPAFTKQWHDRQAERTLKADLVARLDEATTQTVVGARILIERRFREALTTDARKDELDAARGRERARAAGAHEAARERERDARNGAYLQLFGDWLVTRSVTRSTLLAHFPDAPVAARWTTFATHVTSYLRLARAAGGDARERNCRVLGGYLGLADSVWAPLVTPAHAVDPDSAAFVAYARANALVSDALLQRKNDLVVQILAADAAGLSTDFGDLVEDVVPFAG